jgi:hypothetical protein
MTKIKPETEALLKRLKDNYVRCLGPCCENAKLMRNAADEIEAVHKRLNRMIALKNPPES